MGPDRVEDEPASLHLGHAQLLADNKLITSVSISAFGETGPFGHRPGFDPVIQAMSGIMRAQGGPEEADSPVFLTVPINDVLAAGLAALGACASLFARSRLGCGQRVSVTLCASSCLLQSADLVRLTTAPQPAMGGRDFAGPGPADRLYRAADGWVRLAGTPPHDAAGLARAGLATMADLPVAEVVRRAAAAGIPAVRARQAHELTADEQLIRHGLLAVIEQNESGIVRVGPGRWLEMPGLATTAPGEAPAPGEHGQAILREIAGQQG